jgi:tRNA threonylcarbamoyladenosine biosynthesis protein TsaB
LSSDLTVLAFDTSAAHCAAALSVNGRLLAERHLDLARGQAEALMPLLLDLLAAYDRGVRDLDLIAVGIGPGNFTGTRISVAAARGLALGAQIPAMGVSMFEVVRGVDGPDDPAPQIVSLPAPRDTSYCQVYHHGAAIGAPQHITIGQTEVDAHGLRIVSVCGHGAVELAALLGAQPCLAPAHAIAPTIAAIATRRMRDGQTHPARPAPLYVRAADAAPARDAPPLILP